MLESPMRIAVSGGHGRLGRLVVPWLRAKGMEVLAPTRAEVDWTCPHAVYEVVRDVDKVLALAAYTDVLGAQLDPDTCVRDTVITTQATIRAISRTNARLHWVGTDYTLALERGGTGVGWYTAAKSVAERLVVISGHYVARVAFLTPEQVQNWTWVDGSSWSSRCWVEELVPQLGLWLQQESPKKIEHLGGPHPTTLEALLRSRYPDHPALENVEKSRVILNSRSKGTRPQNTSWAK